MTDRLATYGTELTGRKALLLVFEFSDKCVEIGQENIHEYFAGMERHKQVELLIASIFTQKFAIVLHDTLARSLSQMGVDVVEILDVTPT